MGIFEVLISLFEVLKYEEERVHSIVWEKHCICVNNVLKDLYVLYYYY